MEEQQPPDLVLRQAKRRIEQLRNKLSENPDFRELERLELFVKTYDELAMGSVMIHSKRGRAPSHPELIPFLRKSLAEAKRPLTTQELLQKAIDAGMVVGGAKPVRNLSARLSADKSFRAMPGGSGWVLNEPAGDLL